MRARLAQRGDFSLARRRHDNRRAVVLVRLAVGRGLGGLVAGWGQAKHEAGDAGVVTGVIDIAAVLASEAPRGGEAEAAAATGRAARIKWIEHVFLNRRRGA